MIVNSTLALNTLEFQIVQTKANVWQASVKLDSGKTIKIKLAELL
jgi:hypothetical protein